MNTENCVDVYFSEDTAGRAIANYFAKHGISEKTRDYLIVMANERMDEYFQLVSNFVEQHATNQAF